MAETTPLIDDDSHWKVGKPYLIRTQLYIAIGKLIKVAPLEIVLKNVSWIDGPENLQKCMEDGFVKKFTRFPNDGPVIIGRGAIRAACRWRSRLPSKVR